MSLPYHPSPYPYPRLRPRQPLSSSATTRQATPAEAAAADVVVELPSNLFKAASLASGGAAGIELDVPGLISGRIDVDIETPRSGEADVVLTSGLIPQLPLSRGGGQGRFCYTCGNGEELGDWVVARNLKNGVSFYSNVKTGKSQFQAPLFP